jgi:predicted  nucleic acid-binding Zn-ribbon protein
MKFKFPSLVLSALLSTSIATASSIKLSDAYNGLVPEDIKKDAGKLKAYREQVVTQFNQKLHNLMSMQDQLERFYAPYSRKGGEHERVMANAVCDFVEAKVKKVGFVKDLYEGHLGEIKDYLETANKMKGQPHKVGQHAAFLRKIKEINLEIENAQKSIKSQPDQKAVWEKAIGAKNQTIQALKEELEILTKQISGSEGALKENHDLLDAKQEEIRKEKQRFGECSDEITRLQTEHEQQKASIVPVLNPVIEKDKGDASPEYQDSQEMPVKEADVEQIDPAAQQLKDLEVQYRANENDLTEKKGQSFARVTALQEQQAALQTQRETLAKEKETFEQELRGKEEQISEEKHAIDSIRGKIEAQAEEKKSLEAKLRQLLLDKQQKQDEADTYALIKYLTLFNIYSALPNDDFDYHGYKNPLTTLSLEALPTIRMFVNKRAAHVGSENVKLALDREVPKFQASVDKYIAARDEKIKEEIIAQATSEKVGYSLDLRREMANIALPVIQCIASGENIITHYKGLSKDRSNYYPLPMTDEEFLKSYSSELVFLKADHQIKVSMTKWRNKISTAEGSLIHHLGLDSALFNPDFPITSYPQFLSFPELQTSLRETSLVPYPTRLKEKDVWSLGKMQLRINFFEAMNGKDEKVWKRISPVVRFVKSKQTAQSSSQALVAAASAAATKLPLEETKQSGFKHLLKSDQPKAIEHAYLKYISYVTMLYALRHDGEGSKMPSLKIIDSAIESLLREALPTEVRLDNVMAAKAYKWGLRVQEHGEKFIKKNGLLAHIFTPVFEDKAH